MSCLFDSLSKFVGVTHAELRKRIVGYLATNPVLMGDTIRATDVVDWTEDTTLSRYISEMKRSSVWGGGIEIKAFCDIYRVRVVVWIKNTNRFVEFKGASQLNGTVHVHWNGGHYTPVKLVRSVNDIMLTK